MRATGSCFLPRIFICFQGFGCFFCAIPLLSDSQAQCGGIGALVLLFLIMSWLNALSPSFLIMSWLNQRFPQGGGDQGGEKDAD